MELNTVIKECNICKHEYTSTRSEVSCGIFIYVCDSCLDAAKYNFIWVCMNCNSVYLRPKKLVIERTLDPNLKRAYIMCEDIQIIQGIDMCIGCDPEGITNYMNTVRMKEC